MNPIIVGILLFAGIAFFVFTIFNRFLILKRAKFTNRFDHIFTRIWKTIMFAFAQEKFFLHGRVSGLLHAFIFWGFLAVALRTIMLFGQGFSAGFGEAFLSSPIGKGYNIFKDFFQVLVVIGCVGMLFRRLVLKPKRITLSLEGNLILVTILLLMITDFMMELGIWYEPAYYAHIVLILGFLNWLPHGKHFHIITAIPNVFFQKLTPSGELQPLNLEDETATSFGASVIGDFNWKQNLDIFTCTECGRCADECPANATDKPLSPKQLTIDLRNHLYKKGRESKDPLVDNVIKADTVWSCTTCKACEEACPVFIEYIDKIVDMRREMVLMRGILSKEAQTTLKNIETNSNPWGIGLSTRGDWAKDLGVKTFEETKNAEYLYFVGCTGSFDERSKKISRAFVRLLKKAGVSFAILGAEEKCTGDSARRLGNEYLFQLLAKENIATFTKYNIKKIITTCPHCYNTIKNEYPQFGGNYEVAHHTEFLLELIKNGKLSLQDKKSGQTVVYHDSCYLGRHNNIYNAPRELLKLAGHKISEPSKTKDFGRCCGAGGGWMWMEEKIGTRMNQKRLEELQATGSKTCVTACPFCLTMLDDANSKKGAELKMLDVAEVLAESTPSS